MRTLLILLLLVSCGQPENETNQPVNEPTILTNYPGVSYYYCTIGEVDTATGVKPIRCEAYNHSDSFIEEGY